MSNWLQVSDPEFFELCPRNEGHKLPANMWNSKLITTEWKQDWGSVFAGESCEQKLLMLCPCIGSCNSEKSMEREESG